MLSLSDDQLATVMAAADSLPVEKRGVFLERVAARLELRGSRFTDRDLDDSGLARVDPRLGGLIAARRFPPPWSVEEQEVLLCQTLDNGPERTSSYFQRANLTRYNALS